MRPIIDETTLLSATVGDTRYYTDMASLFVERDDGLELLGPLTDASDVVRLAFEPPTPPWDLPVDPAAEAREDELGAWGNPRRCPRHPHVQTSSNDGMHDAPCGDCEGESNDAARAWDHDRDNPRRHHCDAPTGPHPAVPWMRVATCNDVDDGLCF